MTNDDIIKAMNSIRDDENEKMDMWYSSLNRDCVELDGAFSPVALRAIADLMDKQPIVKG